MPEYLTPGVYVEEIEIGPKPIEGVSTSTAGFLGKTERGPITPTLVTGFEQYQKIFGGYIEDSYLTYAMDGFFRNGGKRCFVARITRPTVPGPTGPTPPAAYAQTDLSVGGNTIRIRAKGPGEWGNRIFFKIGEPSQPNERDPRFKLFVMYFDPPLPTSPPVDPTDKAAVRDPNRKEPKSLEMYDDLSLDPKSSSFYKTLTKGSQIVDFFDDIPTAGGAAPPPPPGPGGLQALQGGTEGDGEIDANDYEGQETPLRDPFSNEVISIQRTGLRGLKAVEEISIVCAPDETTVSGLQNKLIDHCEDLKYRFAILQTGRGEATDISTLRPSRESKYAALYTPWINVFDPLTKSEKLIPPGGHVAGIYARSDVDRGVHKAPANELVRGANSLQVQITADDQGALNPRGVNVIRSFPGRGILVWGARTISRDTLWKYVNVRRLFIFVEHSIDAGSQWLVFEVNNERLWSRVIATITQFLTRVWRDGALMGTRPEEAFFVKCDRTTMTQDDIDNGRLIVIIGIAPVKPAEFVIFRIAQVRSGLEVSEL